MPYAVPDERLAARPLGTYHVPFKLWERCGTDGHTVDSHSIAPVLQGAWLIPLKEMAKALGVDAPVLRRACKHRIIEHVRLGSAPKKSRTYRFLEEHLAPDRIADTLDRIIRRRQAPLIERIRSDLGRLDDASFVYFIDAGRAIKIGHAANPAARLVALQTGSQEDLILMGAVPGGLPLEKAIHRHLARYHIRGEWFRATKVARRFVEEATARLP